MFLDLAPQTALPFLLLVGLKPPWNQPQVTPLADSRSPILRPVMATRPAFGLEQSSNIGSGSAIMVPCTTMASPSSVISSGEAPWVLPETRLMAPGLDGPKFVPRE